MAWLASILFVAALVSPNLAFAADPKVRVFDGGMDQLFDATLKAVNKNWKRVQSSERPTGTIRFHTGVSISTWGEDCTVILRDLGNGKIEVSLKSKNSAQIYAWGIGTRIARKLFNSMQDEILPPLPESQSPATATPKK